MDKVQKTRWSIINRITIACLLCLPFAGMAQHGPAVTGPSGGVSASRGVSASVGGPASADGPGMSGGGSDSLLYSFVSIGCNRVDKKDVSASNPSTANLNQLRRTYQDILKLPIKPDFLFFVGDMVMGYAGGDTAVLGSELRAWVGEFQHSGLAQAGVRLVVAPGNHESLLGKGKPASADAEQVWLRTMSAYIAGNNGPGMGGPDSLATDQSRLTYSFDFKGTHFVMLNTDAVGRVTQVPYRWVIADVVKARAAGAAHIFLLSHKPAYIFSPGEDGLGLYPAQRDTLWAALEQNHVEAFLSAHDHLYYRTRPHEGKTWQIISGNGGSPLSAAVTLAAQKNYGFTLIQVFKSGRVLLTAYGRDVPADGYMGNPDAYPTTVRDTLDLTWGK
jgi:hypothetical protein